MKGFAIIETVYDRKGQIDTVDVLCVGARKSEAELDELVQSLQPNYSFFTIDERNCSFLCIDKGKLRVEVEAIETEYN